MNIKPIKTEADHQAALCEIERLMNAAPNTPEGDCLEVMTLLVVAYEAQHHPIGDPDPIEAILHRMEAMGMDRVDLEPILGHRGRVSEVLNRKRPLTLEMIRRISEAMDIPADVLVRPYETQNRPTEGGQQPLT
jgi:HTH-type transcriptional regulator/antitoxin HigA